MKPILEKKAKKKTRESRLKQRIIFLLSAASPEALPDYLVASIVEEHLEDVTRELEKLCRWGVVEKTDHNGEACYCIKCIRGRNQDS